MSFYQNKAEFYKKQYELAMLAGKKEAAAAHKIEWDNYLELIEMSDNQ